VVGGNKPILQVEDLSVHYGAIQALRGVSLSVPAGEVVALIGANGAGKTTTLRAVSRMLRASGGHIRFEGEDVSRLPSNRWCPAGWPTRPRGAASS
jgi:branched-chain amino acid transport system ATP-binding protein